ncbi:MAG: tyrosine-type recombinase/integrase [Mycobacterium sp.]|nr:tyrosine-type recombinase/integrase [Mycobacterium sp.]
MSDKINLPVAISLSSDIEVRDGLADAYRARVRWTDPHTKKRKSISETFATRGEAEEWIGTAQGAAGRGVDPHVAAMTVAEYGTANMQLALRGIARKTTDPYLAGWRKRVVPVLGHLPLTMVSNGIVDRAIKAWISDGASRSTVKSSLAVLVLVMEQAVRDEIIERNPSRVFGWQRQYELVEDEVDNPRALALADFHDLQTLSAALVAKSNPPYQGWGDAVIFAACTAARIGEVSGCLVRDINTKDWLWTVRRQTTPSPGELAEGLTRSTGGGLVDKGTKGRRSRVIPLIPQVHETVMRRLKAVGNKPDARLFTGPRGGPISTAGLRRATHWNDVVTALGYEYLTRHGLRHTGLTWMADSGVKPHVLQKIAGHGSITTTQRYLHPDYETIAEAGGLLSNHLIERSRPNLRSVE